jgi:hypothetical protein
MAGALLEDLIFQAVPLGEKAAAWPPGLAVHIPVAAGTKAFTQPVPFFARRPPMVSTDTNWPAYCGTLKDFGIPLQTTVPALESLSIANVPVRFARRAVEEGFELHELGTADAIEISCVAAPPHGRFPSMPLETAAWHELKQLIECLRDLCGPTTPIGLGLLAGDIYTDISNALAARVDFVILELPSSSSNTLTAAEVSLLAWSVAAARLTCNQAGAIHFPVYIDAPLTDSDHFIKLLALGATAVSIDALAWNTLPPATASTLNVPKGLLSGIGSVPMKAVPNVEPFHRKLDDLIERLKTRLQQQHLNEIGQLNRDQLRALSDQASRLCGVRLLEH